jgi:hypothetical protein
MIGRYATTGMILTTSSLFSPDAGIKERNLRNLSHPPRWYRRSPSPIRFTRRRQSGNASAPSPPCDAPFRNW